MRRILVEVARRKRPVKHGGDRDRIEREAAQAAAPAPCDDLIALDAARTRLATVDPQAAKPVALRHFTGLTVAEVAQALGIARRTVDRLWAFAPAWLHRERTGTAGDPES